MSLVDTPGRVKLGEVALYHHKPNGVESFEHAITAPDRSSHAMQRFRVRDVLPAASVVPTTHYVTTLHINLPEMTMSRQRMAVSAYLFCYKPLTLSILLWMP